MSSTSFSPIFFKSGPVTVSGKGLNFPLNFPLCFLFFFFFKWLQGVGTNQSFRLTHSPFKYCMWLDHKHERQTQGKIQGWLISAKYPCRLLNNTLNVLPQSWLDNLSFTFLNLLFRLQMCLKSGDGNSGVSFSLLSGNHFGSNWSYHGQPHLLHLPCSHLQKDPKEWHNCPGYLGLLTDYLLIDHFSLGTLLICSASSLSVR